MKKPYRDFNLPSHHLTAERHFVPPKARSSSEIERRHEMPRGTILAEHELAGFRIADRVLGAVEEWPDIQYAEKVVAPATLNTAQYGYAAGGAVMSRRLKLPVLAVGDEPRQSTAELLEEATYSFSDLVQSADWLVDAIRNESERVRKHRWEVGRMAGDAALLLSTVTLGDRLKTATPFVAQTKARERGLITLDNSRALGMEIGTPPSIAQLADPNSDLSVYIRRTAPNTIHDAFSEAQADYGIRG